MAHTGEGEVSYCDLWIVPLAQFNVLFLLQHLNVLWETVYEMFVLAI